jgi:hypothetical protein
MTTKVLSLRLRRDRAASLKRLARRLDRSVADTAARLIDEGLRRAEFSLIEFRDTPLGRQAYVEGTRLAVWQVVRLFRVFREDIKATAAHLQWPEGKVRAALNYAEQFADEIEEVLSDTESFGSSELSRLLPSLEVVEVPPKGGKRK